MQMDRFYIVQGCQGVMWQDPRNKQLYFGFTGTLFVSRSTALSAIARTSKRDRVDLNYLRMRVLRVEYAGKREGKTMKARSA